MHSAVVAATGQPGPTGGEGNCRHVAFVVVLAALLSGLDVPQPHRAVLPTCGQDRRRSGSKATVWANPRCPFRKRIAGALFLYELAPAPSTCAARSNR